MQKDVIYIDVEDDITAIIGKVKSAKEKIVAIVPPKRIGVLQSAVNLRLLSRAADSNNKHLVLITSNQALVALSAAAKIPVAKNLQSKPEIADVPSLDNDADEDIIDGAQLPVGELAKMADKPKSKAEEISESVLASIEDEDDASPRLASPPKPGHTPAKARVKSGIKVPSFDVFRKKVFIIAGLGVLLVAFLVWAIFFAASATVIIDARTTGTEVKTSLALGPTLATSAETATLKSISQQDKETTSVSFTATGTQDVGDKASGSMTLTRSVPGSVSVPYGSGFTSGTCTFLTQAAVTVPGATPVWNGSGFSVSPGTVSVNVQATAIGEDCNLPAGDYDSSVAGISASGGAMAGGTKRTIKIVTQDDVEKAKAQLATANSDDIKKKLQSKFDDNTIVIDSSFQAAPADPTATPAVGAESTDGNAKLTSNVTYTMSGVAKADLDNYLQGALQKQIDKDQQRVYDDGISNVKLTGFAQTTSNATATLDAIGKVGPKIDDDAIKQEVKGKRYGEVQTLLKGINGVNDADTKFSPFWVSQVPNDVKKINIQFKLDNGS